MGSTALKTKRVGVVAIQGAIGKHLSMLEGCGASVRRVLRKDDLDSLDALVFPGGESTTISKGLTRLGLVEPIQEFVRRGGSVLGTCAGAILLARECSHHPVPTLGLLDVRAVRNAYGTQTDSFASFADPGGDAGLGGMRCVFIRAPQIRDLGPEVDTLLRVDGLPVLVRQGRILASSFHPQLGDDDRIHRLLLEI